MQKYANLMICAAELPMTDKWSRLQQQGILFVGHLQGFHLKSCSLSELWLRATNI
jgi:hypothetical protein